MYLFLFIKYLLNVLYIFHIRTEIELNSTPLPAYYDFDYFITIHNYSL